MKETNIPRNNYNRWRCNKICKDINFDNNGKGSVRKQDYAEFLAKVFIQGNRQEGYQIPNQQYLKRATLAFSQSKQQQEIGVQDFYQDLLSKFYQFLADNQEFHELIPILFEQGVQQQVHEQITPQIEEL